MAQIQNVKKKKYNDIIDEIMLPPKDVQALIFGSYERVTW